MWFQGELPEQKFESPLPGTLVVGIGLLGPTGRGYFVFEASALNRGFLEMLSRLAMIRNEPGTPSGI